jgi:hypothetical protein
VRALLRCSNPIHELSIAGRAVGMRKPVSGRISIVGVSIGLLGDPVFLPSRSVFIPDQSTNAADRKN